MLVLAATKITLFLAYELKPQLPSLPSVRKRQMTSMHSGTTFLCNLLQCAGGVYIVFPAFTGLLAVPITERNTVPQIRSRSTGALQAVHCFAQPHATTCGT